MQAKITFFSLLDLDFSLYFISANNFFLLFKIILIFVWNWSYQAIPYNDLIRIYPEKEILKLPYIPKIIIEMVQNVHLENYILGNDPDYIRDGRAARDSLARLSSNISKF